MVNVGDIVKLKRALQSRDLYAVEAGSLVKVTEAIDNEIIWVTTNKSKVTLNNKEIPNVVSFGRCTLEDIENG